MSEEIDQRVAFIHTSDEGVKCEVLVRELPVEYSKLVEEIASLKARLQESYDDSRYQTENDSTEIKRLRGALERFKNINGHFCFISFGDKHAPECERATAALGAGGGDD